MLIYFIYQEEEDIMKTAYINERMVLTAKCDECGKRVWFDHMWEVEIPPFGLSRMYHDPVVMNYCEDCCHSEEEAKEYAEETTKRMHFSI